MLYVIHSKLQWETQRHGDKDKHDNLTSFCHNEASSSFHKTVAVQNEKKKRKRREENIKGVGKGELLISEAAKKLEGGW